MGPPFVMEKHGVRSVALASLFIALVVVLATYHAEDRNAILSEADGQVSQSYDRQQDEEHVSSAVHAAAKAVAVAKKHAADHRKAEEDKKAALKKEMKAAK